MKKVLFFLVGCSFLLPLYLSASTAVPTPIRKIQPDGTEIIVMLRGDEKIHWMETPDGYTLMYDTAQYVVYATTDNEGNMIPSAVKYLGDALVAQSAAADAGLLTSLKKGIWYSPSQKEALLQIWEAVDDVRAKAQQAQQAQQPQKAFFTGIKKALCVLMQYPDKPLTKTRQDFDNLINQVGYAEYGARGSVHDFYIENSYGLLDLQVTVAGPYTAARNHNIYANGSNSVDGRDLAKEAVQAAHADGIDLSEYATNNRLETFHVIYAGHGEESSGDPKDIWAHKWFLRAPMVLDGVTINDYSCSPELRGASSNDITCIGVICHELCHVFGSPDYYDSDGGTGGNFIGTGEWDLMGSGEWNTPDGMKGNAPAHINMFQKIRYGWVTPIELTDMQKIEDMPNAAENAVAYTIKANDNGEHYILENKQYRGFDVALPGHGLLIYHVHQNAGGATSNAWHPQQLYPVNASAIIMRPNADPRSYGDINSGACPFPGTNNKTSFSDESTPMMFSWATSAGINKPITEIVEANEKISFYFKKQKPIVSFTLNNGDATTSKQTVNLTFTLTGGGTPAEYAVSENEATLNSNNWITYDPAALTYTFETNEAGFKTVYAKLKNEVGETDVQSAGIYYKPLVKSGSEPPIVLQEWSAQLYPTVVKNNLTVAIDSLASKIDVRVFSTSGNLYFSKTYDASVFTIDLSNCPAGILLIQLSGENKYAVKKIIKS
jgi:M6 family metalloprotease-like protein